MALNDGFDLDSNIFYSLSSWFDTGSRVMWPENGKIIEIWFKQVFYSKCMQMTSFNIILTFSNHFISIINLQFMFSLQVYCHILFVGEPFLTHRALKLVLDTTLKPHVSVKVVVPVVTFTTFLTLERLLRRWRWLLLLFFFFPFRTWTDSLFRIWASQGIQLRAFTAKNAILTTFTGIIKKLTETTGCP